MVRTVAGGACWMEWFNTRVGPFGVGNGSWKHPFPVLDPHTLLLPAGTNASPATTSTSTAAAMTWYEVIMK